MSSFHGHCLPQPCSWNHCILAAKSRSFERILKWLVSTAVNSYFSNNEPCLFPNSTPHSFLCFPVFEEIPSYYIDLVPKYTHVARKWLLDDKFINIICNEILMTPSRGITLITLLNTILPCSGGILLFSRNED